jgi:hypothetical protein
MKAKLGAILSSGAIYILTATGFLVVLSLLSNTVAGA